MAGQRLARRTGDTLRKQRGNGLAFHGVVVRGGCAVQVEVIDLFRCAAGSGQRLAHGGKRAAAFRFGGGYMVGVGTGAAAKQGDGTISGLAGHQKQRRRLADVDAVAVAREGIAQRLAGGFQRGEALQGQVAQAVDTAAQHCIANAGVEQAFGAEQGAGTGGAGGGDGIAGATQLQPFAEKARRRRQFLMSIVVARRKAAIVQQAGDAFSGFLDAGGAGAQDHTDAMPAVAGDGLANIAFDLQCSGQQQLVVAGGMAWIVIRHCRQR